MSGSFHCNRWQGQARDIWSASSTSSTSTGSTSTGSTSTGSTSGIASITTGNDGRFVLYNRGLGTVSITAYRTCYDSLTNAKLDTTYVTLAPAAANVSVSPLSMLMHGLHTLRASSALITMPDSVQDAAFEAMNLDRASYDKMLFGVSASEEE